MQLQQQQQQHENEQQQVMYAELEPFEASEPNYANTNIPLPAQRNNLPRIPAKSASDAVGLSPVLPHAPKLERRNSSNNGTSTGLSGGNNGVVVAVGVPQQTAPAATGSRTAPAVKPLGTSSIQNNKENNDNRLVDYENLRMDYIAQLTGEGYSQDAVIRALGVARNDLPMARDILYEFAAKRSQQTMQAQQARDTAK